MPAWTGTTAALGVDDYTGVCFYLVNPEPTQTMDQNTAEFQYVKGQMHESFGELLTDFERRNAEAVSMPNWEFDRAYGSHPREVLDMRPADQDARGTLVYFHAGYWQSRDKSQFRFLAPALNELGWDTAWVNYPLCPEASVSSIVASAALAVRHVAAYQAERGRMGPIVLCGHSAGAHLAIELALQYAKSESDLPLPIAGVVAISGIFDLRPLTQTTLNQRLNLDMASAVANSPTQRVRPGLVPALFMVGETETPAFHQQSQEMARLWRLHGNTADFTSVAGYNHFSVLKSIAVHGEHTAEVMRSWTEV